MLQKSSRSLITRVGVTSVYVALVAMACTANPADGDAWKIQTADAGGVISSVAHEHAGPHHQHVKVSIDTTPAPTESPQESDSDAATEGDGSGDPGGGSDSGAGSGSGSGAAGGSGLHSDVAISHGDLLSGSSGWSDAQLTSHSGPINSEDGPFPDIGTFRVFCQFSHQNFDDAIVFPGAVDATHLHTYFGNTGTDAHSTAATLRTSGNSTCSGGIVDRSAYWVPSVVDGTTGRLVQPAFAAVYYQSGFGNGIDPESIQPIPRGLKMLSGRATATPSSPLPQSEAYWGCFHGGGAPTNQSQTIPDCPSGSQVTMIVNFPQCWNGTDLDSSDHISHMRWPDWRTGCPSGYVPIPRIMLQVIYPQDGSHGTAGWFLSSDMYPTSEPGGASMHADFVNAWDEEIMGRWLDNCIRAVMDCEDGQLGGGEAVVHNFGFRPR